MFVELLCLCRLVFISHECSSRVINPVRLWAVEMSSCIFVTTVNSQHVLFRGGFVVQLWFGVELAIKRSPVRLPVWARLRTDSEQVVHTLVPLTSSHIIWFNERQRCATGKVTVGVTWL